MPTRLELLKQAGFSDDEIGGWVSAERQRMQAAGLGDGEIDEQIGITRPPKEVPPAFIERLKQGNWFYRILGAAGEYGGNYFGDEPPGLSPERQLFLHKFGLMGDLASAAVTTGDVLLRSVPAGIGALSAGVGQAFEEAHDATLGPGPYAKGKAARDFAQLGQIAALLAGAKGPNTASVRAVPSITNGPLIELPRAEDFRNAAASISGSPASFGTEQKLLRLWKEHGIHPNEVAADGLRDQGIAETMRSDSAELPETYIGHGKASTASDTREVPLAEPGQSDGGRLPTEPAGHDANQESAAIGPLEKSGPATDAEDQTYPFRAEAKSPRATPGSNLTMMYNPPPRPQRPFTDDYPGVSRTQGLLRKDIEGRPLTAQIIAGRRTFGGPDESLSPANIRAAMPPLDIRYGLVPSSALAEGTYGNFHGFVSGSQRGGYMFVDRGLPRKERNLVTAHEFGHALDLFANDISKALTKAEENELRFVYGTVRSGSEMFSGFFQPEDFRYPLKEVNLELVAEGLRTYMADPNYFKTMAPETAAKIRAAVNRSPHLKKVIQFNSLAAGGLIGAGSGNQDEDNQ